MTKDQDAQTETNAKRLQEITKLRGIILEQEASFLSRRFITMRTPHGLEASFHHFWNSTWLTDVQLKSMAQSYIALVVILCMPSMCPLAKLCSRPLTFL